ADPRGPPARGLDRHARALVDVLGVDDHLGREARPLVELLLHGDAFEDVAELHRARRLGEDRDGVRVPLGDHLAALHLLAVALLELRAVHHRVALALAFPVGLGVVDDRDLAVALAHHDQVAVLALDRRQVDELDEALVARLERGLLGAPARPAADAERPHGPPRARLAGPPRVLHRRAAWREPEGGSEPSAALSAWAAPSVELLLATAVEAPFALARGEPGAGGGLGRARWGNPTLLPRAQADPPSSGL